MKSLVIIPTYNEKSNIENLIDQIFDAVRDIHILVIDDNSPDGTANLIEGLSLKTNNLALIKRTDKRGRGLAGIAGFKYAINNKYDYAIEMDADFSHNPKYIPIFLKEIEDCDVVVGSRLISGGNIAGRDFIRNLITRLANLYIKLILGVKVKDATSGFRCFRRDVLENIPWDRLISEGPSIVEEVLYIACQKGYRIKEIPIVFEERRKGKSKLSLTKILSIIFLILRIRMKYA